MGRFLSFDSLITPSVIKFIFLFIVIVIGISAVVGILSGIAMIFGGNFWIGLATIIGTLIASGVGVVLGRISCEMTLIIFMIRDELAWQRENATSSATSN